MGHTSHRALGLLWLATAGCTSAVETDAGADEAAMSTPDLGVGDATTPAEAGACGRLDFASLDLIVPDRSCTADTDCDQVPSRFACCPGALRWRGVATTDEARFSAEIASCDRGVGPVDCGCLGYESADDGTRGDPTRLAVSEVHCVGHVCTTTFPGSTLCGTGACTASQVCVPTCVVAGDGAVTGESTPSCQYPYPCDGGQCVSCNGGTAVRLPDGGPSCTCP